MQMKIDLLPVTPTERSLLRVRLWLGDTSHWSIPDAYYTPFQRRNNFLLFTCSWSLE